MAPLPNTTNKRTPYPVPFVYSVSSKDLIRNTNSIKAYLVLNESLVSVLPVYFAISNRGRAS